MFRILVIFLMIITFFTQLSATAIYSATSRVHPVIAKNGMVASQEALASKIGLDVLKKGGNAIDAAVTVGFALAVTLPRAGNIGGGGFMMIYDANTKQTIALDYREVAPLSAGKDLFLNDQGDADPVLSRDSALSVGVPGTVAGLALALEKYGTITLKEALKPAIHLAKNGILVTQDLHDSLNRAKEKMKLYPDTMRIFFKQDGSSYDVGERLIQKDLAKTLSYIAKHGVKGFYEGNIAKSIASYMENQSGIMNLDDLKRYKPIIRQPVQGNYRGYDIVSMPPPSSGGVHLIQMLNILEGYDLKKLGHNSAAYIHLLSEVMKRAYADRSKHLGDTDFVSVPLKTLLSKDYAQIRRKELDLVKTTPSDVINPFLDTVSNESDETTHFSVVDKEGNAVSNTYTLNFSYGNKRVVPGTGILLNNEMDDFSAKPGVPNAYGLIGGEKNAIEPQKRMLSSMSPTIVLKDGKPYMVTGTPGGSRIITTVLQLILNVIDHDLSVAQASVAPRIHHQWFPDELRIEEGLSPDTLLLLEKKGHILKQKWAMGSSQSIVVKDNVLYGFSDLRKPGALTVGF